MVSQSRQDSMSTAIAPTKDFSMALYDLTRAQTRILALETKPFWSNSDTASFDCMHYDGNQALERCALKLALQPGQEVIDIGSGFNSTGRYLASQYHVSVTGVEYQSKIHELAVLIRSRNEDEAVRAGVSSVNGNWLDLEKEDLRVAAQGGVDAVVSFLCILHMRKDERRKVFEQAARFLKPGGQIYIEDYYLKRDQSISADQMTQTQIRLQEIVDCPWLPTEMEYHSEVIRAGFEDIHFRDVSDDWTPMLRKRAEAYRSSTERDAGLQIFYDTVAELFEGGTLRGVRLTAVNSSLCRIANDEACCSYSVFDTMS